VKAKPEIVVGSWYQSQQTAPRKVIACGFGHVIYGNGGDVHRECEAKTFIRWALEATTFSEVGERVL
jgi:hypothetical protein